METPFESATQTPGRAWTCRIVSLWGATRQPRQNSNGSADTPTCAAPDSSGGGGLEEARTLHQGDEVPLSDVRLSELSAVSLSQVSAYTVQPPSTQMSLTVASQPQAAMQVASREGRRRSVHEMEWRARFDRLSRGRGLLPRAAPRFCRRPSNPNTLTPDPQCQCRCQAPVEPHSPAPAQPQRSNPNSAWSPEPNPTEPPKPNTNL